MPSISQRKKDHVDIVVSGRADYRKTAGFERYDFVHNALPEVNLANVSTECDFLGRTFSFPLFISSMTGGYAEGGAVNALIAAFCEKYNLPFGVGSQRAMLVDSSQTESFSVVRNIAPTAFIAANIGGCQLIGNLQDIELAAIVESIKADAVIVHLNPLRELMQPEGDRDFKGIIDGIAHLVDAVELPVIVKETGAGIDGITARRLFEIGVTVVDVAGAGGTSWSKVENQRKADPSTDAVFDDWGIPTVDCLLGVQKRELGKELVIASGGLRSAFDIAKSLCLGADMAAMAGR